jgi:hypothetical protein
MPCPCNGDISKIHRHPSISQMGIMGRGPDKAGIIGFRSDIKNPKIMRFKLFVRP